MRRLVSTLHLTLALSLIVSGCVNQTKYVGQIQAQEAAGHHRIAIGEVQNFTSIKLRHLDRERKVELSYSDDPKIQSQFSNQGDFLYYSDNTGAGALKFVARPIPAGLHPDWDRLMVLDGMEPGVNINYISMVGEKDYFAKIVDNGASIHYKDSVTDITLLPHPLPATPPPGFDALFITADDRYGMFRSLSSGIYRFYFLDAKTKQPHIFDFLPLAFGFQSTQKGGYRGVIYNPNIRQWLVHEFLPTRKLICFDLARAYEATGNAANRAVSEAALRGILVALAGYSTATFSGTAQSTYSGYYSGSSTTSYSGYAQVYDYRYLAAGTVDLLNTVFAGKAALSEIEDAMRQQNCGFTF